MSEENRLKTLEDNWQLYLLQKDALREKITELEKKIDDYNRGRLEDDEEIRLVTNKKFEDIETRLRVLNSMVTNNAIEIENLERIIK